MTKLNTTATATATAAVPIVPPRPALEHVLIVGHSDNYFEVFADSHIRVHFEQLPTTATAEGEILAEQFIETQMPRPFRQIYYPSNRRLLERVEPVSPSDIARRQADVKLLRGIQQFGKDKGVNIRLETMPYAGMNAEAELLAEELLAQRLPLSFKNIFTPGLRTTLGRPLSAKPSDIAAKQYDLSILHGLQKFEEDIA